MIAGESDDPGDRSGTIPENDCFQGGEPGLGGVVSDPHFSAELG